MSNSKNNVQGVKTIVMVGFASAIILTGLSYMGGYLGSPAFISGCTPPSVFPFTQNSVVVTKPSDVVVARNVTISAPVNVKTVVANNLTITAGIGASVNKAYVFSNVRLNQPGDVIAYLFGGRALAPVLVPGAKIDQQVIVNSLENLMKQAMDAAGVTASYCKDQTAGR